MQLTNFFIRNFIYFRAVVLLFPLYIYILSFIKYIKKRQDSLNLSTWSNFFY